MDMRFQSGSMQTLHDMVASEFKTRFETMQEQLLKSEKYAGIKTAQKEARTMFEEQLRQMELLGDSLEMFYRDSVDGLSDVDKAMHETFYANRQKDLEDLLDDARKTFSEMGEQSRQASVSGLSGMRELRSAVHSVSSVWNTVMTSKLVSGMLGDAATAVDYYRQVGKNLNLNRRELDAFNVSVKTMFKDLSAEYKWSFNETEVAKAVSEVIEVGHIQDKELVMEVAQSYAKFQKSFGKTMNEFMPMLKVAILTGNMELVDKMQNVAIAVGSVTGDAAYVQQQLAEASTILFNLARGNKDQLELMSEQYAVATGMIQKLNMPELQDVLDQIIDGNRLTMAQMSRASGVSQEMLESMRDTGALPELLEAIVTGIGREAEKRAMIDGELSKELMDQFSKDALMSRQNATKLAYAVSQGVINDKGQYETLQQILAATKEGADGAAQDKQLENILTPAFKKFTNWLGATADVSGFQMSLQEAGIDSLSYIGATAFSILQAVDVIKVTALKNAFLGGGGGGLGGIGDSVLKSGKVGELATKFTGGAGLLPAMGKGLMAKGVSVGATGSMAGSVAAIAAPLIGVAMTIGDAITGFKNATALLGKERGESTSGKISATVGTALGGSGPGVGQGSFGRVMGNIAGGAAKGALIGTVFGPVGTLVGGAIGAGLAAIGGERLSGFFKNTWDKITGKAKSEADLQIESIRSISDAAEQAGLDSFETFRNNQRAMWKEFSSSGKEAWKDIAKEQPKGVEYSRQTTSEITRQAYETARNSQTITDQVVKETIALSQSSKALPSYAQGTPWVPDDQIALIHKGEAIVPADVVADSRTPSIAETSSSDDISVEGMNQLVQVVAKGFNDILRQMKTGGRSTVAVPAQNQFLNNPAFGGQN